MGAYLKIFTLTAYATPSYEKCCVSPNHDESGGSHRNVYDESFNNQETININGKSNSVKKTSNLRLRYLEVGNYAFIEQRPEKNRARIRLNIFSGWPEPHDPHIF